MWTILLVLAGCEEGAMDTGFLDTAPAIGVSVPQALHDALADDAGIEPAGVNALVLLDTRSLESLDVGDLTVRPIRVGAYGQIGDDTVQRLRLQHVDTLIQYQQIPMLYVHVTDEAGLTALATDPAVVGVYEDVANEAFLDQSLPLIGQSTAYAAGRTGSGASVAVLDTGVDYTASAFGSCSAPGGSCKVAYAADFATDDHSRDDEGHGTNVSGIVLGVAPEAKIIGLDVFTGASASSSVIISAIDWVIANQATYNIQAINMSLGSGAYTSACSSDVFATPVSEARAAGILTAAASGNSAYTNAISTPACTPAAVSVGAVYDSAMGGVGWTACTDTTTAADKVTCFSNSASFLTMLAPGALINAAGYSMGGTSQASPHVAGAIAALRGAAPTESVDATVSRLTSTGVSVTDTRNGITKPRLNLAAAASDCVTSVASSTSSVGVSGGSGTLTITAASDCSWTAAASASWLTLGTSSGTGSASIAWTAAANTGGSRSASIAAGLRTATIAQESAIDETAPTGTVSINAGAAGTASASTTLTLSATDATAVSQMCISNTSSCSTWLSYTTSKAWTLASGTGTKTVYVWWKDSLGNTSASPVTDTIVYDTTAPSNGTATATGGSGTVAVAWSGFSDAGAGIASYKVVYSTSSTPSSCSSGTTAYSGSDAGFTHSGLTNGTTYYYRVCAVDAAGNTSTGASVSGRPAPEMDAPTGGSVVINGGSEWTNSSATTLTLSASDASGVSQMCISNSSTCSSWVTYATSKAWTITASAGTRTVYVWFKDAYGNTTSSAVTDTIGYDATAPSNGTPTGSASSGAVGLSWTGYSDAGSGIASYKVVYSTSSSPSSCSTGTTAYTGTSTSYTHSGLANGTTYYYRVCAVDTAGNTSTGSTVSARPAPEYDAPTGGSVSINAGAAWTNSASTTLTLSATDASGLSQVCISNSSSCSSWVTWATSQAWTITASAGTRTVYVWFKDLYGNTTTASVTDTIGYDATAPSNGSLSATAGTGQVALSWSGFSDGGSGLTGYKVVAGSSNPSSCSSGTTIYTGTATTYTDSGLSSGKRYYRVCGLDLAGNTGTGATANATVP